MGLAGGIRADLEHVERRAPQLPELFLCQIGVHVKTALGASLVPIPVARLGRELREVVNRRDRAAHGRESLAKKILRSPFSQEKMTYQQDSQTMLYRSKMNPNLKRNFDLFPVLD